MLTNAVHFEEIFISTKAIAVASTDMIAFVMD
jgi:hypothetical protein